MSLTYTAALVIVLIIQVMTLAVVCVSYKRTTENLRAIADNQVALGRKLP